MLRIISIFSALAIAAVLQGCAISNPSLKYGFVPAEKIAPAPVVRKIVVMKPLDIRGHAGTTPVMKAYIPFYPFVREIREPEAFTYDWNAYRFDYEKDFAELVAMDLAASGIASNVMVSTETKNIQSVINSKNPPDYIIKLSLNRLDWQRKFTMYGISILGYLPQACGAPDEYGFSYLKFSAEILDAKGNPIANKTFSAIESQNGWIYYFTGFLRALTRAYTQVSPDLRSFVADSVSSPR
ncbi:MAG: hypothetical protein A2017_06120 [Lentisphaerae bacterium GWF2_44_16]|nr:MAG: hypothetical protein A2017_06120 [Lentisphaerae bacterium GWF2_44_16]